MKTKRISSLAKFAVLVFALALGSVAFAETGTVDALGRRDGNAIAAKRVTQAQREAAAALIKAQRESLLNKALLQSAPTGAMAMPALAPAAAPLAAAAVAQPGGAPDYFGCANWAFSPAIRKFVDTLPGLGPDGVNNIGQYIDVLTPDTITYPGSDYYEISVREFSQKLHSDLPPTRLRGYVQTNKGTDAGGNNTITPSPIRYLGGMIIAQKDRPVRIKFTNELPTGTAGELFLPVDKSVMGAGVGPLGTEYSQNRAVLHLHGGKSPWISDGTPHQWITPAGENTSYKTGVSMQNVPDMPDPGAGSQTYYYTNQQSARLMFYHDHSYGITRLNVYAGEAAGFLVQDPTEKDLVNRGIIPANQIPLIIQDKSFVDETTVRVTDPTWNWGTGTPDGNGIRPPVSGDLWYPHIYSPAQNPYNEGGVNAYGRWHYGPWFFPPTTDVLYPPIPNPYYDPINAPWEPPEMPACPNPSMPGESFFDTMLVNGTAFPILSVEPKPYRFRILNAANDRFLNLQFYKADPATTSSDGRTLTEVKMVPADVTPGFPELWPTDGRVGGVPDPATIGPSWIQIGNEGGFLPMPTVIPNQPITWNMDPTTFNFGNVLDHSLLLAPAERADVIVDFSAFAGQTLILYNDAPAAFPALDARYDYYTGAPDLTGTGGHPGPQVGFGPNIRTVMQIKVATAPVSAFNMAPLMSEFTSTPTFEGVFERSQHPIIVGQAAYNDVYSKAFPLNWPNWGYARIQDMYMNFETVPGVILNNVHLEPKAIHDEMGAAYDIEYGRMSGKLGLELQPQTSLTQNFILQTFVDPVTEIITDSITPGPPTLGDGTQLWKITHNGVDTHPIHFHLFDVQVINRVGWDGQIRLPDANELGWKETVRVSPLEDTIVALRATAPKLPFGIRNSVRYLSPATPPGSPDGFSNIDPLTGQPLVPPTTNILANFGWEYVWHCHILSHEEMDMMRPIAFDVFVDLPDAPTGVEVTGVGTSATLIWTDPTPPSDPNNLGNPKNEIGFQIERATGAAGAFELVGTALANATSFTDTTNPTGLTRYRVLAFNAAGVSLASNEMPLDLSPTTPAAPTGALATAGNASASVSFEPPASSGGSPIISYTATSSPGGFTGTGDTSPVTVTGLLNNNSYTFTVTATNSFGTGPASGPSNAVIPTALPTAPTGVTAARGNAQAIVSFTPPVPSGGPPITSYTVTSTPGNITTTGSASPITVTGLTNGTAYTFTVAATNSQGTGAVSEPSNSVTPATLPGAPKSASAARGTAQAVITFGAPTSNGGSPIMYYTVTSSPGGFTANGATTPITVTGLTNGTPYTFTVKAVNDVGTGPASTATAAVTPADVPNAPAIGTATAGNGQANITFTAPAYNGGSPITMYTATSEPGGITASKSTSPITVTGLTAGISYTFTVAATNAMGIGASSAPSNAIVPTEALPGAPTGVTAAKGNSQAAVSFNAALANGSPITLYTVTSSPDNKTETGASSPITVTGLTNGKAYTFKVTATNGVGTGPASMPSAPVTPSSVPDAPTITNVTAGVLSATVTFKTPAFNGGSPITGYTVISDPDGVVKTGKASPITVSGLRFGVPYTFSMTATNAIGTSSLCAPSNAIAPIAQVPGAPTAVTAVRGDAEATVSFTPPAYDGGTPVTSYTVTSSYGGKSATGPGSPITVTGLANGSSYAFSVKATNLMGTGPASVYSKAVTPATIPDAPKIGIVTKGVGQATVPFSAPAFNGGSAITSYTVTSDPGGITASKGGSPIIVTGLTGGTSYTFTVTATNAIGTSAVSAVSNAVIPTTSVPGAPTAVKAVRGDGQATVSFTPPASNGGSPILGYIATSIPGGIWADANSSPIVVTGLKNGTAYAFSVKATNASGTGPASGYSPYVTPATVPGAPTIGKVTPGVLQASVAFTAPTSNGGSAVTGYTVTSDPGGITSTGTASPIIVKGLSYNVPYTFTVTAKNAVGTGPASGISLSATPTAGVPGAPTAVTAARGNEKATVSFTPPASDGGTAITSYTVTSSVGGKTATGPGSPIEVGGLTNGTAYAFNVKATNAIGTGPASAFSTAVTPATIPNAPTLGKVTAGVLQATVAFTPPAFNGGSPITGYIVTSSPGGIVKTGTASPITVTGLTYDVEYTFTVMAANVLGTSVPSAVSAKVKPTAAVPGAPTAVSALKGSTQATVSFTPPVSNGGTPIISYLVTSTPGGITASAGSSPIIVSNLKNGTAYAFNVKAQNAIGYSPASPYSTYVTPATVPSAPIIGNAVKAGAGKVTVNFTAPVSNGGSAITMYTVTSNPGAITATRNVSPITVPGLVPGTTYTFTVKATNSIGTSASSDPSNQVTP